MKDTISDLSVIENEIRYSLNDMKEIFNKFKCGTAKRTSDLFRNFSDEMSKADGEALSKIWSENIRLNFSKNPVNKNDSEVFEKFGLVLGAGDIDTQLKNLENFKSNLKIQLDDAESKYQKRGILFGKLGIYAGILFVVIFI